MRACARLHPCARACARPARPGSSPARIGLDL